MFETSVVPVQAVAARGRLSLLTISIFIHSAVVVGAIAASIASVDFPAAAPNEYALAPAFAQVTIPPPLGNPNAGQPQPAATPPPRQETPTPTEVTAPAHVPDATPAAEPSTMSPLSAGEGTPGGTEPGPLGQPWGVESSPGPLDGPPGTGSVAPPEEKIYVVSGDVKAPVLRHRVDPPYPHSLLRTRMKATVVVRCIIDRNGSVRDPQVVVPAMAPFNHAVIEAVQKWRFTPGSLRGQAVDTYFDLTVTFSVN